MTKDQPEVVVVSLEKLKEGFEMTGMAVLLMFQWICVLR